MVTYGIVVVVAVVLLTMIILKYSEYNDTRDDWADNDFYEVFMDAVRFKVILFIICGLYLAFYYNDFNEISTSKYQSISYVKYECDNSERCKQKYKSITKDGKITGFEFEEFIDEIDFITETAEKEAEIEKNKNDEELKAKLKKQLINN